MIDFFRRQNPVAQALLSILVLCAAAGAAADDLRPRIDALVADWHRPDAPGCAIGVIRDGEWALKAPYGLASLEHGIPISSTTSFRIASASKQFTAFAVLLLAERGLLDLEADVRRFVPELPVREPPVRIRHLLENTAGYREYLDLMALAGHGDDEHYTAAEALAMLARQREHNFEPGAWHLNCDTCYFLLAEVVERLTGKSLRRFADEEIFRPLGMRHTRYGDDRTEIIPERATGYAPREGGGFRIDETQIEVVGDGGVFTTLDDLLAWDRNFYAPRVGSAALIARMTRPVTLSGGLELGHANGLAFHRYRGLLKVEHGGAFVGFRSSIARFPGARLTVICLCNRSDVVPWHLAQEIADLYLADRLAPETTTPIDAAALAPWAGAYRDRWTGVFLRLEVGDGVLVAVSQSGRRQAYAAADSGLLLARDGPRSWLELVERDGARQVHHHLEELGHRRLYEPVELAALADASEYAGRYRCGEVPLSFELTADGGRLVWQGDALPPRFAVFEPTVADGFANPAAWSLDFLRGAEGRITGLRLGAQRALHILCLRH